MNLSVLYRGPISSCNYGCNYCPFSKRIDTRSQLERDRKALFRFTEWITSETNHRWKILFTPWGEALVRSWYRDSIARLTQLPHFDSVGVQTNLSCQLNWIAGCSVDRLAFWATFHPNETTAEQFLRKVLHVHDLGANICVGAVGVPEFADEIERLRQQLPANIYLWINPQQPLRRPYTEDEIQRFQDVDPQFRLMMRRLPSRGKTCPTGETAFTIDGNGQMRRCHFVDDVIGNCYEPGWEQSLRERPCPNRYCDCFLGKSQLMIDSLTPFFGDNVFQRLPVAQ